MIIESSFLSRPKPAGHGDAAAGDRAEDLLDMALRIPLLLAVEAEDLHALALPARMTR